MRRIISLVVALIAVLSLLASGMAADTVLVFFVVGSGTGSATQLWRCNRDASGAVLIYEGSELGYIEVDSATQNLIFVDPLNIRFADLDGTITWTGTSGGAYTPPLCDPTAWPIDAEGGYMCDSYGGASISTSTYGFSDYQSFDPSSIPGMVANPTVLDVAIYVGPATAVQSSTWGRIKARFK